MSQNLGMKWYKFLKFALVLGGILNIITGVLQITGYVYLVSGVDSQQVYYTFPTLKPIDIGYGVFIILLSFYQFSVVKSLSGYKANSLTKLTALYVISMISGCAYTFMAGYIIGNVDFADIIGTVIGNIIIISINNSYFKKRSHLFVY